MSTTDEARRQVEADLRQHSRRPVRQQLEALVRRVEALERLERLREQEAAALAAAAVEPYL